MLDFYVSKQNDPSNREFSTETVENYADFKFSEEDCGLLIRSDEFSADHFFTTRNTDLSNLPFGVIRAEKQIHSAEVVYINEDNAQDKHFCDGFVIDAKSFGEGPMRPGIGIRTADCTPILLCDPEAKVAAAVHAGWRGTIRKAEGYKSASIPGIAANAVRLMTEKRADPRKIQVAIGACIHKCCFEVREDFISEVNAAVGKICDNFLLSSVQDGEEKTFFDLLGLNVFLLQSCGIKKENIFVSPHCTACNTETFFSFRAEHGLSGTMLAAIRI